MTTVDRAITEFRTRHAWRRAMRRRLVLSVLAVSLAGDVFVMAVMVVTGINLLH